MYRVRVRRRPGRPMNHLVAEGWRGGAGWQLPSISATSPRTSCGGIKLDAGRGASDAHAPPVPARRPSRQGHAAWCNETHRLTTRVFSSRPSQATPGPRTKRCERRPCVPHVDIDQDHRAVHFGGAVGLVSRRFGANGVDGQRPQRSAADAGHVVHGDRPISRTRARSDRWPEHRGRRYRFDTDASRCQLHPVWSHAPFDADA